MTWQPLPSDAPLDHEALPPPGRMQPTPQQPDAPQGFSPLPDSVELDQAAPDGSGFSDEQQRQILDYLPKAMETADPIADLERFSLELSGGKAKIGNAAKIVDELKGGTDPSAFRFTPPVVDKSMAINVSPTAGEQVRNAIGDALLNSLDQLAPGLGTLLRNNRDTAKAGVEHAANAVALDYGPEVGGVIETALHGGSLDSNVAHERATLEGESATHPIASAAGELGGVGLAAPLGGAAADAFDAGKVARFLQSLAGGAAYGSGAAGPDARIPGALVGAVTVPALKGVAKTGAALVNTGKSVLEGSPGLARRIVAKAIAEDANTPESVGADMAAAHANGVPMALADTGENVRGLLAAASRSSGGARTVARDALSERQAELADRVTGAIQRDLGPVANPHEVADTLMTKARDDAAPLYEQAYSLPGADTFGQKAAPLFQRPSMQKALANAYRIAKEEGRDPTALGFDVNSSGEVSLGRVPSWQTLDYVKRGLDDVVESYRDPVTGKLNLDTEGRAINNTRASFLKAFDQANPTYAQARKAWGGPVSGINAMNLGRKALNMTADDLEARMRDMTPFEKNMFALGTRRAMAELVQSKGDTADVVNALVGTGKKRAMLGRLFGDQQTFQRFVDTLGQEREGFRTFKQAMLGSPTAANLQDDSALQTAATAADLMLSGGIPVATATRHAIKFLGVKLGKKAQEQIAALLSNTDPTAIRELAAELRAQAEKRGIRLRKISSIAGTAGKGGLAVAGQQAQ